MGLAEMVSTIHDTPDSTAQLAEMLGDKLYLIGSQPSWIDFCVYETWAADSAILESNSKVKAYVDRMTQLPNESQSSEKKQSSPLML